MEQTRLASRWLVTWAVFAAMLFGSLVPVPGVVQSSRSGYGLAPVIGAPTALAMLVAVRGFAAIDRAEGRERGWAAFLIYVVAVGVWGFLFADRLEELGAGVVPRPGLSFRMLASVSLAAGGALTWLLADVLGRAGLGSGPLLLAALAGSVAHGVEWLDLGVGLGLRQSVDPWSVLPLLGVVLVAANLRRQAPDFPWVPRPWLRFRSVADLIVLPIVVHLGLDRLADFEAIPSEAADLGALLVGLLVVRAIGEQERRAGSRPAGLAAGFAGVAAVLALGLGWLTSGAASRLLGSGPLDGPHSAVVRLSTDALLPHDVHVLEWRMQAAVIDGELEAHEPGARLTLRGVSDPAYLAGWLVLPGRFSVHGVREDLTQRRMDDAELPLPEGTYDAELCQRDLCDPLVVDLETPLPGSQLITSRLAWHAEGTPFLYLHFDDEGAVALRQLTEDHVGRRVALILDGWTVMAPIFREPLDQGRLEVSGGAMDEVWLEMLGVVIRGKPLESEWAVLSVRPEAP